MNNDFINLCKTRHSIRKFSNTPVDDHIINQLLEIIRTSPSAGNLQAFEVVIVKSSEDKERLSKASYNQKFISQAPFVLGFSALPYVSSKKYGERGIRLYSIQDATIACTYAMLGTTSFGLSSTWVGSFDDSQVKKILKCEPLSIPVALLPIGYAAEQPKITSRKAMYEISRELN